jgi:hypothetical protein
MTLLRTLRQLDHAVGRRGDTRRVLVDSRTAVNYEMVAPVLRAMAADTRVRFAFTASEEPARLPQIYRSAPPGTAVIGPGRAALRRWDAYLTSDFMWATLPRGAARIQMFHGVAGKYGFDAPNESMRQWDRLFFVNQRRLRNFIASGAIDADSRAARLVGMPKVDCLVDGSLRQDRILRQFELDPSRPTVLYAPTWSPASSLNRIGMALVERLMSLPVNVIVKLHDRSRDLRPQYSGGIDWVGRLGPLLDRPNGRLAPTANIAPCLAAADVMISDHSSAAFEYLLLDRPLVRIDIPELIRQANVHPEYVQLLAGAADNVTSLEQTIAAVERALADPGALSASRRAVASDLFYRPGSASARCAAALYEVLELTPHASVAAAAADVAPYLQTCLSTLSPSAQP